MASHWGESWVRGFYGCIFITLHFKKQASYFCLLVWRWWLTSSCSLFEIMNNDCHRPQISNSLVIYLVKVNFNILTLINFTRNISVHSHLKVRAHWPNLLSRDMAIDHGNWTPLTSLCSFHYVFFFSRRLQGIMKYGVDNSVSERCEFIAYV
jgi:hypothetical protein